MNFLNKIKDSFIYVATSPFFAVKNVYNFYHNNESIPPTTKSYVTTLKEFFYWKFHKEQYVQEVQSIAKHEANLERYEQQKLNFKDVNEHNASAIRQAVLVKQNSVCSDIRDLKNTVFNFNQTTKDELLRKYERLDQQISTFEIPYVREQDLKFTKVDYGNYTYKKDELVHEYETKLQDQELRIKLERENHMVEIKRMADENVTLKERLADFEKQLKIKDAENIVKNKELVNQAKELQEQNKELTQQMDELIEESRELAVQSAHDLKAAQRTSLEKATQLDILQASQAEMEEAALLFIVESETI